MQSLENIIKVRIGGKVQRCHTNVHIGEYSVAEHSWGVAMLMMQIYPECPELIPHCLVHDIPEAYTGDIPSPSKGLLGNDLRKKLHQIENSILLSVGLDTQIDLTDEQRRKIRFCDCLELFLWSSEQVMMGNKLNRFVRDQISEYIERDFSDEPFWKQFKQGKRTYNPDLFQRCMNGYK